MSEIASISYMSPTWTYEFSRLVLYYIKKTWHYFIQQHKVVLQNTNYDQQIDILNWTNQYKTPNGHLLWYMILHKPIKPLGSTQSIVDVFYRINMYSYKQVSYILAHKHMWAVNIGTTLFQMI